MSVESAAAGQTAVSMVRAVANSLQGQSTSEATVEAIALELLATDGPEAVMQATVALAGIAAASIITLAASTDRDVEALLAAFGRGIEGGASDGA